MNDNTTPLFASGTVFEVTQEEDQEDEFQSYCLPNQVLIKALEEVEQELGLNQERKRLITHMLQMRANLERYLTQQLSQQPAPRMLYEKINRFASLHYPKHRDLIAAMHTIRDYGNKAAHNQAALPGRDECSAAVAKYSSLKAVYENAINVNKT